jgi:type III secretion protein Q
MHHYSRHPFNTEAAPLPGAKEDRSCAEARAAAPDFPFLRLEAVTASNAWYGRRAAFQFDDPRLRLGLTPRFRTVKPANENLLALTFSIGGSLAQLIAPAALLAGIIADYGVNYSALSPQSALLLLEHRLSTAFEAIERGLKDAIIPQELLPLSRSSALQDALRLDASCALNGEQYWVELILPLQLAHRVVEWLSSLPSPTKPLVELPVMLAVRAGCAQVTLEELESLGLNDVLLVDSPLAQPEMLAVFGERYGARARWEDGRVSLLEPLFPLSDEQRKVWSMTDAANEIAESQPLDGNLDDIQIKLTFEVGREEMELGALRALAEGHIFELGRDPRAAVDILAGSRRIGQGELVRISETLGIRVTRLFNHE